MLQVWVQYFESLCYRIVVWTSANFASESERTGEYTDVLPSDYGYKKVFGNYSPTILGHGGTGKFKLERCLRCRGYPVNVHEFHLFCICLLHYYHLHIPIYVHRWSAVPYILYKLPLCV